MKWLACSVLALLLTWITGAAADPRPAPGTAAAPPHPGTAAKLRPERGRLAADSDPGEARAEVRHVDLADDGADGADDAEEGLDTAGAFSKRLFAKKFFHLNHLFGNKSPKPQPAQPIIIITGAGSDSTDAATTSTDDAPTTSTLSVPSATGSITTEEELEDPEAPEDAEDPEAPADQPPPSNRRTDEDDVFGDDDDDADAQDDAQDDSAAMDADALRLALAAGAQQYGVVGGGGGGGATGDAEHPSNAKASAQPARVWRRKEAQRDHFITVRIPLKYKRYFQSGQKVVISQKRGNRKRGSNNRRKVNRNKKKNKKNSNSNSNRNKNKNKNKKTRIISL